MTKILPAIFIIIVANKIYAADKITLPGSGPPPPPRSKTESAGANLSNGETIYFLICQPCHGNDGQGGPGGGAPLTDSLTVDDIMTVLYNGRNAMPEFGSVYSDDELRDIAAFVVKGLIK